MTNPVQVTDAIERSIMRPPLTGPAEMMKAWKLIKMRPTCHQFQLFHQTLLITTIPQDLREVTITSTTLAPRFGKEEHSINDETHLTKEISADL